MIVFIEGHYSQHISNFTRKFQFGSRYAQVRTHLRMP